MKVVRRILLKLLFLILVVGICGGAAAFWKGSRESKASEAAMHYVQMLISGESEAAYQMLDQSSGMPLTLEEYQAALEGKKYAVYPSFRLKEDASVTGPDGRQRVRYLAEFLDAENEVRQEELFTFCMRAEKILGFFPRWTVLPDHCLIENYTLMVPADSQVWVDEVLLDRSLILSGQNGEAGTQTYQIPHIFPGKHAVRVWHPVLAATEQTIQTDDGPQNLCQTPRWNDEALSEGKEIGVYVMKNLLSAAVRQNVTLIDEEVCQAFLNDARNFVGQEGEYLQQSEASFVSLDASSYTGHLEDPVLLADGGIQAELVFSYHYEIQREMVTVNWEEYNEDGTPVEVMEPLTESGTSTANFTLEWKNGQWKITKAVLPVTAEVAG